MSIAYARSLAVALTPDATARRWQVVCLVLWSSFLFLYGLNAGELYRNEGLRGRIAQEMFASGDWIVPRLYEQPIFSKPPLMYWLICACSLPFGEVTTISARLPSVLAAFATVGLFAWYFRRCLGRGAGCLAALLVPLSIFWLDKTPSAEIDAVQVAWVAASIVFFLRGLEDADPAPQSQVFWWLHAGLCLAGGTLTKWTAPAFLYGTAIPLLWLRGRLRLLVSWRHLALAAPACVLVAGWMVLAASQTSAGELFDALVREAAPRLIPAEHPKGYSWIQTLVHPAVFLFAALPCSLALLMLFKRPAYVPAKEQDVNDRARLLYQGLHCWLWPNLLFWTLHPDHTLRNRAPILPAAAGLAVFALLRWQEGQIRLPKWLGRPRSWVTVFLVVWIVLKTVQVEWVAPAHGVERQTRDKAAVLNSILPSSASLYLSRLRDECLLFYLGRPAMRIDSLRDLPKDAAGFCLLTEEEWQDWNRTGAARLVLKMRDGQGEKICVVQIAPT